jgi:hypothetical protein
MRHGRNVLIIWSLLLMQSSPYTSAINPKSHFGRLIVYRSRLSRNTYKSLLSMNKKTKIYFGPPLAILTENEKNTLEISGKLNRAAERYLEIMRRHGVELTEPERQCLLKVCESGYLASYEIMEMADDVREGKFDIEGLDTEALSLKLKAASFADLVTVVESLGY